MPPGMTAEQARQIRGTGPQIASGRGGLPGGRAGAAGATGARGKPVRLERVGKPERPLRRDRVAKVPEAAASDNKAAAIISSSSARRATWVPAPRRRSRIVAGLAMGGLLAAATVPDRSPVISAIGSAPAKEACRPAPISVLRHRTQSGSCLVPQPSVSRASCYMTPRPGCSPTIKMQTNTCGLITAKAGK